MSSTSPSPYPGQSTANPIVNREESDELSIIRGSSRLVSRSSKNEAMPNKFAPAVEIPRTAYPVERIPQPGPIADQPGPSASEPTHSSTAAINATPAEYQIPPDVNPDTFDPNALDWLNMFTQPGYQPFQPMDLSTSIGMDNQTFANLVPDTLFDTYDLSHPSFDWNQFMS